jgi:hypothetical protein
MSEVGILLIKFGLNSDVTRINKSAFLVEKLSFEKYFFFTNKKLKTIKLLERLEMGPAHALENKFLKV